MKMCDTCYFLKATDDGAVEHCLNPYLKKKFGHVNPQMDVDVYDCPFYEEATEARRREYEEYGKLRVVRWF